MEEEKKEDEPVKDKIKKKRSGAPRLVKKNMIDPLKMKALKEKMK